VAGFSVALRGINYAMYVAVASLMIHVLALTCPDPQVNYDGKEYFTKQMKVVEACVDGSASAEMRGQLEGLRRAFSINDQGDFEMHPSASFTPSGDSSSWDSLFPEMLDNNPSQPQQQQGPYQNMPPQHHHQSSIPRSEVMLSSPEDPMLSAIPTEDLAINADSFEGLPWDPAAIMNVWSSGMGGFRPQADYNTWPSHYDPGRS